MGLTREIHRIAEVLAVELEVSDGIEHSIKLVEIWGIGILCKGSIWIEILERLFLTIGQSWVIQRTDAIDMSKFQHHSIHSSIPLITAFHYLGLSSLSRHHHSSLPHHWYDATYHPGHKSTTEEYRADWYTFPTILSRPSTRFQDVWGEAIPQYLL